jgi:enoyl-CoA hydratase
MELKNILYTQEDGIGILTLNRPKAYNATNLDVVLEENYLLDKICTDPELKVLIVTGGSRVFAAGGDIEYMSTADSLQMEEFITLANGALDKIANFPRPVIAAIAGMALGGGCELALACDIRIAAEGTIFGQPEINLGIIPGAGGTQRLQKVVGPGWAKYLVMTGRNIDTETALKIGLINSIVPLDRLMEEAKKLALELAKKSTIAMKAAKACMNYGVNVDLPSGLLYEQKTWSMLFSTEDQKEGMEAFLEKRKPQYTGK